MLKSAFSIVLFSILTLALTGCGPRSDDTTPDMAERLLKLRGYFLTQQDFFKAIRLADGRAVKAFLQAGMDPNVKDADGRTALTFALEVTDASMIEPLMDKADLMLNDSAGNSPVFMALKYNHRAIFDRLLEKGADVNSTGKKGIVGGQTLLSLAVEKRDGPLVRKLLENGADPNRADDRGNVPLFETVRGPANAELLGLLLEKGADVNTMEKEKGVTVLIMAASNFAMDPEVKLQVMKTLLEKGADPNKQDTVNGYTALMYTAADYRTPPETRNQVLKMLLEKGADKTLKTVEGETPLEWAKEIGDAEMAAILK